MVEKPLPFQPSNLISSTFYACHHFTRRAMLPSLLSCACHPLPPLTRCNGDDYPTVRQIYFLHLLRDAVLGPHTFTKGHRTQHPRRGSARKQRLPCRAQCACCGVSHAHSISMNPSRYPPHPPNKPHIRNPVGTHLWRKISGPGDWAELKWRGHQPSAHFGGVDGPLYLLLLSGDDRRRGRHAVPSRFQGFCGKRAQTFCCLRMWVQDHSWTSDHFLTHF
mmetsp:Transcript_87706/g.146253  ORF Transcript_87706/g.146253 Transcript_87706/m.146253 type:complete len:220 (-) Transcript_87706:558-1217(-)